MAKAITLRQLVYIKVFIHLSALATFLYLLYLLELDKLGADPVKELIHFLGKTAFNFLLLTLMVSPFIKAFKQPLLIRLRRLLGLYSFFWALLHLSAFLLFELDWQLMLFIDEVIKRPYLSVGAGAFFILLLLAMTSFKRMQRLMKKHWLTLHRFVYWAVLLVAIHYYWSVKSGVIEPIIYLVVTLLLLLTRKSYFLSWLKRKR